MSLTINTGMTTKDGGTVASGAFVQFDAYFVTEGGKYNANISIWRSEAGRDSGLRTVNPVEVPRLNFEKTFDNTVATEPNPTTMHQDVQAFLEGYLWGGTGAINPMV